MTGNVILPALLKEWQCPDGATKRGCGFHGPAIEICVDDQRNDDDHQEPGYVAKQLGDYQQDDSPSQRYQQGWDAKVAFVDRASVEYGA